jgi:hypothetical protein
MAYTFNNWGDVWGDIWNPIWAGTDAGSVASITGTAVPVIAEPLVVAGGKTIVITLSGDTWVAAGATFDAERQAIIDGLDSAQSEVAGWNAEVRDNMAVGTVVRTSATVVTITLPASASYQITAPETITVTVPASALTGAVEAVAGTFLVTQTISYGASKKRRGISLGLRAGM